MLCPRCGTDVEQQYYGPCETCRDDLRAGAVAAAAARKASGTGADAGDADRPLQGQERAIGS